MSQETMREEFEAAVCKGFLDSGQRLPDLRRRRSGAYLIEANEGAWWGWQASRAALVVEFPDTPGMYYNGAPASALVDPLQCWREGYEMAAKRVKEAGLKVKT